MACIYQPTKGKKSSYYIHFKVYNKKRAISWGNNGKLYKFLGKRTKFGKHYRGEKLPVVGGRGGRGGRWSVVAFMCGVFYYFI